MKKYILDNLPTIWVIAVFVLGMALAANHANANENKYLDFANQCLNVIPIFLFVSQ